MRKSNPWLLSDSPSGLGCGKSGANHALHIDGKKVLSHAMYAVPCGFQLPVRRPEFIYLCKDCARLQGWLW